MRNLWMAGLLALGCSGDEQSFQTDLPPERLIQELNGEELRTLCTDLDRLVFDALEPKRIVRGACALDAVADARDPQSCEMALSQCEGPLPELMRLQCSSAEALDLEGCTLTVERWGRCVGALYRMFEQAEPACGTALSIPQDCERVDFEACLEFALDR